MLARAAWWMLAGRDQGARRRPQGAERFRGRPGAGGGARGLPRLVALVDADNELLVDLDNVARDRDLRRRSSRIASEARLVELFPGPDLLAAAGPEGRFVNEIVVPFVRKPPPATPPRKRLPGPSGPPCEVAPVRRSFPPGSEWLYAKLYTGTATADRPAARGGDAGGARAPSAAGAADRWFFIRYGDPEWHLRVRFHGDPARLQPEVLPRLHAALDPLLADGRIWRVQLDTYEREIERYGGPEGIALAERLFQADSDAVLDILEMLEGDEGADVRWRLALRGIDMLLGDLGFDPETRMRGDARHARGVHPRVRRRQGLARAARPAVPAGAAEPGRRCSIRPATRRASWRRRWRSCASAPSATRRSSRSCASASGKGA